jgi:predicted deacylase
MANGKPNAGLMDVPSQLDTDDLAAEVELELPDSSNVVMADIEATDVGSIEISPEDDGGVIIDFDPQDQRGVSDDFYANLAEEIPDRELARISSDLLGEFDANKASRQEWEDAYTNGLELLGFTYDERTQPFRGASGVTHPLLAEAATQFQAQAFNELLPASGPVRTVVMGKETASKTQQASRVRQFMNYYITNVMEEYTPDMDQMLFYLPLAGSTFKKTYFDETLGRAVSKFVPAENLVVPYETADLETCPNITQVVRMSLNDLRKRQIGGTYLDVEVLPAQKEMSDLDGELDRIEGLEPNQIDYDCTILECHVDLDLEGYEDLDEDGEPTGIKIPYVVTISEDNGQVLSVRRNYREDDELRKKIQYFTHFKFLPGFGFYGLGLIHTIGGLSRTATAALRQLIDAGTLSNLPAGFKARGLRIRDDDDPLQPGEFRDVDAPGGAIRDSLMPLPFKGPDQTLFNLLGFVVEAGQRFATITDLKVGDGNQQAAVGTTIAMMEQGTRVMSAVHKRLHYAMKQEFKILARVMSESLPQRYPYTVPGGDEKIMQADFDGRVDVVPVSNPNVFSQAQRIVMAQTKLQLATQAPELHNLAEVFRDMYEALGVTDIDRIMKSVPEEEPKPIDPAQENINALDMVELHAFEGQNHQAHITAHLVFGASPMVGGMPPVAMSLQKHVMEHVQIAAKEQAAVAYLQQMQQKGGQPATDDEMLEIERMTAQFVAEGLQQVKELSGQLSGAGAPDPLVQLKEQELQIKAQADQADQAIDQAKVQLDAQNQQMRGSQFDQRLASQEKQTQARIDAAMQRELLKNRGG